MASFLRVTHRIHWQDGYIRFAQSHELSGMPKDGYNIFYAIYFHVLKEIYDANKTHI